MNPDNNLKPIRIDLNDYDYAGEGANGASYNHKTDPSVMMKMYFRNFEAAALELELSKKVYEAGIPTPEPGDLVTDGERMGIRFRRVMGKTSFARAAGNHPEQVVTLAQTFATMCRQLHSTHVDTTLFPNVKDHYLKLLADNPFFSPEQKNKMRDFILSSPDADTALHGDLQFGNGIFVDDQKYFIDLGDFCYGYPMYDLGMVYLTCKLNDEAFTKEAFHMDNATASKFWDAFAPAYFGPDADLKAKEEEVRIYAGLKTLIVERDTRRPMPEFRAMLEGTIY